MAFCRCCGKEIHETAIACPFCGGQQKAPPPAQQSSDKAVGPIWAPIVSLVFGLLGFLAGFDEVKKWDTDTIVGVLFFCGVGIFFGSMTLSKQSNGRGMAIAGIVTASLGLVLALGHM